MENKNVLSTLLGNDTTAMKIMEFAILDNGIAAVVQNGAASHI
jgi:hypothetical protein